MKLLSRSRHYSHCWEGCDGLATNYAAQEEANDDDVKADNVKLPLALIGHMQEKLRK